MAEDSTKSIVYIVEMQAAQMADLAHIRHHEHLRIAQEGSSIWIKGFTSQEINSTDIQSIPFKTIYTLKDQQLYPLGALLPIKKIPSALMWVALERMIPVALPAYNNNYFGLNQTIKLELIPSENEQVVSVLLVSLQNMEEFIGSASADRLSPISWCLVGQNALLVGKPLLPISGETYWIKDNFILPAGYDFNYPAISQTMNEKFNATGFNYILWKKDNTCIVIAKSAFTKLTRGSFKLTAAKMGVH